MAPRIAMAIELNAAMYAASFPLLSGSFPMIQ